jgi:hypothetical protein
LLTAVNQINPNTFEVISEPLKKSWVITLDQKGKINYNKCKTLKLEIAEQIAALTNKKVSIEYKTKTQNYYLI